MAPIADAEFAPAGATRRTATEAELAGYLYSDAAAPRGHRQRPLRAGAVARSTGCPTACASGSLAAAVDRARRRRPALSRAARRLRHAGVHGAEHRARRRRRLRLHSRRRRARAAAPPAVRHDRVAGVRPIDVERPRADRGRRAQPGAHRRDLRRARAARRTSPTRSPRSFAGESAVVDHYKVQQESVDAFHVASMHVHAGARARTSRRTRSRSAAGSCATTSTRCSTAKAPSAR